VSTSYLETGVCRPSLGSKVEGERSDVKPHFLIVNKVFTVTGYHGVEWGLEGFVIHESSFSDNSMQFVEHMSRQDYNIEQTDLIFSPANSGRGFL
jgi:hypothetical protein